MVNHETMHKGWYSRGYLPHYDSSGVYQSITFRLADALPKEVTLPLYDKGPDHLLVIDDHLDQGYGACYLRGNRIGRMVEKALLYFNNQRYRQIAWVVMPNHVHTLIKVYDDYPLSSIVHSWKSYTANQAHQILGITGQFWYRSYYDRFIRDERHLWHVVNYIHNNPVKAGLVKEAEDWGLSSARKEFSE